MSGVLSAPVPSVGAVVPSGGPRRRVVARVGSNTRVVVCTNKDCRRRGGKRTLSFCQELAPAGVEVEEQDCLDECGMGPNVELQPDGKVVNGLKTREAVATMLSAECVNGEQAKTKFEKSVTDGSQH